MWDLAGVHHTVALPAAHSPMGLVATAAAHAALAHAAAARFGDAPRALLPPTLPLPF